MFTIHSGTILMFHIPPPMLNIKVQYCICSIASDHSVALFSLKERKIVLLANRQSYPVVGLRWRINDDFLLIKCSDGSLYVWQIETGNLDRVAHGVLADELFDWYNDVRLHITNGDSQNDAFATVMTSAHYLQIRPTRKRRDYDQIRKSNRKYGGHFSHLHSSSFDDLLFQVFHAMIWWAHRHSNTQNTVCQSSFSSFTQTLARI